MNLYQHNHTEEDGTVSIHHYSISEDDHSPVRPEDEARDAESGYTITNERIAEMLDEINAAGDDHFDVAYSWDEYDGATTAAQYAETDAAYVLSDETVIEYDEPEHAFVARRES